VLQVVVYAGAIMVLFLFVIMLLNVKRESHERGEGLSFKIVAFILAALLSLEMGGVVVGAHLPATPEAFDASTKTMAAVLFSGFYFYVFEATSILILAALVGAVVLAKKEGP
jgi:NADH-quinone oxidoreductase subunit J